MRVLVFDDDSAIGRLVVRTATMSGMDAVAVTDALGFAQHMRSDPPQIVVLDLQLGGTDGVEQLRWLADRQYGGAVLLMSGFDPRVLATARALGQSLGLKIESVLHKPLRVAELEEVFERLQAKHQAPTTERLREAIANDEMSLEFQPVVIRNPAALMKLEALIRWDHPVAGRIPPNQFLPVAERDTATIDALTNWVLGAVVEAYQVLAELGISVPLAVNLSAQNLHDMSLPDRIEQRMMSGGMPARHLYVEITESAAFENAVRTMDILSRLRLKGMHVSIDDFGTGYSSLKLLQQMPFSEIKIDRTFVSELTTSREARAIVKSIIHLAANMEIACVAEGIENEETADLLEQMGVADLQGYLIAHSMPVEAVPAWLAIWTKSGVVVPGGSTPASGTEPAETHGQGATADARAGVPSAEAANTGVRLPPRQLEVMMLLSEGNSVKEIARRLSLGVGTVKVHLSLAYSALGARNRIEAIKRAGPIMLSRPHLD